MTQALARSLVFLTSASILVIEVLAMRLLAPYLGISLEVFTGVIGVILAGIAIGAWIGGRLADRTDPSGLLGPALIVGGLSAMASPLLVDRVGPHLTNNPVSIVIATMVAFLLPAIALSTVPPLVVKLRLSSLAETGAVVGSYSAIGTAGAIFGTFVTGFVLVASFPTRTVVVVLGSLLVVLGLTLWTTRARWAALVTVAMLVGLAFPLVADAGPCHVETAYHCALIVEDTSRPTGRTLILDRLHNSYVDLSDPTYLHFRYINLMADLIEIEIPAGPLSLVAIGGGGMTLPGYYAATRPGGHNIALEIDGGVVDLARSQLGLSDQVEVMTGDARISLKSVPDEVADVVIGDAFSGASVPWHLTTVEYLGEIERVLRPAGIYTMNVIDFRGLRFARAAAASMGEVFENVVVVVPAGYLNGISGGNFVLLASNGEIDVASMRRTVEIRGLNEVVISGPELDAFTTGAIILRDDFAPVDQILGRS